MQRPLEPGGLTVERRHGLYVPLSLDNIAALCSVVCRPELTAGGAVRELHDGAALIGLEVDAAPADTEA